MQWPAPRLFLVRHGQASLGSNDYDRLSDTGRRQARCVADRLSGELADRPALWTGTLLRHRQTAEPLLLESEIETRQSADLDEFSTDGLVRAALAGADRLGLSVPPRRELADPVAHLDGLLAWFPQVLAAWQGDGLDTDRIGTWADFSERVQRPIRDWESVLLAGRSVIAVTSAGVIATLLAALGRRDLVWQRETAVAMYNASVSELALTEGKWEIQSCNCIRHLQSDRLQTRA